MDEFVPPAELNRAEVELCRPARVLLMEESRVQAKPRFEYAHEALVSEAYDIAWDFIERTYAIYEEDLIPQAFLAAHILSQYERGERRKLALANRAIAAYERSTDPEGDAARALGVA